MSFERRIALLSGAAVAVAIVLAAVATSLLVERTLREQIDVSLRERAAEIVGPGARGPGRRGRLRPRVDRRAFIERVVGPDGRTRTAGDAELPAAIEEGFSDAEVEGGSVRVLSLTGPRGETIQVARPLGETESVVARVRLVLALVAAGGIALAAALGLLVARRAAAPLLRLTDTAERVARTGDLSERIVVGGTDEIGRLAARFNEMLDALDRSMAAQRALVADASHELRTPVTALRTNIEVLEANPELDPVRRATLLDRTKGQAEELTRLVNDVIEVARGEGAGGAREEVRLDELVDEVVGRAQRDAPGQRFEVELEETVVSGDPVRLARAVRNLLDNAVKFGGGAGPVEVRLRARTLTVRDHGPGIDPAELGAVFDRFFRGAASRDHPGSGLGLAIVRQVAEAHGGSVGAADHPGGGALMTLRL